MAVDSGSRAMDAPAVEKIALSELQRRFELRGVGNPTHVSIRDVVVHESAGRWTVAGIAEIWRVEVAGKKPFFTRARDWPVVHIPTRTKVFEFEIDDATGKIMGINLDMTDRLFSVEP